MNQLSHFMPIKINKKIIIQDYILQNQSTVWQYKDHVPKFWSLPLTNDL